MGAHEFGGAWYAGVGWPACALSQSMRSWWPAESSWLVFARCSSRLTRK